MKSSSTAGKAKFEHESGDTFCRTFRLSNVVKDSNGVVTSRSAMDLTGYTIRMIISNEKDGAPIATLVAGDGLAASDLTDGEIKTQWETEGILEPDSEYWYKLRLTSPEGITRTRLEDLFTTK